ncbi:hypothetical protein [Anaerocolumna sp.]|uniref:hypothetical protein n=1 Tax=Anaerocolumna sp. TaxID=2041569 RepID=UPI0028AE3225|nr:hypothetical protein [Anaerocolumna sp.]
MYTEKDAKATWNSMINRCANGYAKVCDEWKSYIKFKQWYFDNVYGTKQFKLQLDKDLFSIGEKIYSPETCCFLPKSLNSLIASCTSRNGLLPGVQLTKANTYKASIGHIGKYSEKVFEAEYEAFEYYKIVKEKHIKIAAEAYEFLLPDRIYKALLEYEIKPIRRVCRNPENLKKSFIYGQGIR